MSRRYSPRRLETPYRLRRELEALRNLLPDSDEKGRLKHEGAILKAYKYVYEYSLSAPGGRDWEQKGKRTDISDPTGEASTDARLAKARHDVGRTAERVEHAKEVATAILRLVIDFQNALSAAESAVTKGYSPKVEDIPYGDYGRTVTKADLKKYRDAQEKRQQRGEM